MKKFTILLVLLCAALSVGSAQVQKRTSFSSVPDAHISATPTAAVLSTNLPLVGKSNRGAGAPVHSSFLSPAEVVRAGYSAPQDDSGWIIPNAVPGQGFLWGAGICQVPSKVNLRNAQGATVENSVIGFAQFFPPDATNRKGKFTIDTVALRPFQFPNGGIVKPPVKQSVLLFGYAVKANLQSANGWNFSLNDPLLRQLGGGELEIPADVINTRTVLTAENRLENILNTVVPIPNWVVEPDETFGFVLYMQNQEDSLEMYGTYMTDATERDSTKTLGYFARREATTGNEFLTKESYFGYYNASPDFQQQFPSMVNRAIKANFFCVTVGNLETSSSVETLSDDARAFALEPVTPNPVVGATKIQFSLQQPSQVSLRVTNSLGQVVKELASGAMNTGTYSADFDANDLPTGMYYYTLVAGTQSLTRSMVVVK